MLKLDNENIAELYLSETEIVKAYMGNDLVFEKNRIYTVIASVEPAESGTVTGMGEYQKGETCTLIATIPDGYIFSGWQENGNIISTSENYTFIVNANRTLIAVFIDMSVKNYSYTGEAVVETLYSGDYRLEVWGAEGGYRSNATYAGKGGYSVGVISISKPTPVFVYVGGSGNTGGANGGFNGGGKRSIYNGGGGASDIRIGTDDLNHRVIVAGGGGSDGGAAKSGKYGGGKDGGNVGASSSANGYGTAGYGGTQTGNSGGDNWIATEQSSTTTSDTDAKSGFGFGGNGVNKSSGYGGAGGGGWYGGTGRIPDSSGDDDGGGGGGSGFIWTGINAPAEFGLTKEYCLNSAETISGNASFFSPAGISEIGHSGNGYARITPVISYIVTVISEDDEKGTVSGSGKYASGSQVTVSAKAISGFKISGWYKGDEKVSSDKDYTFVVNENIILTAKFEEITELMWETSQLPSSARWENIAYDDERKIFATIAYSAKLAAYSGDGINWKAASTPPPNYNWSDIVYGDGKFIAVSTVSSNIITYSSNGGSYWSTTTISQKGYWKKIAYGNKIYVALADGTKAAYTNTNITSWTNITSPISYAIDVFYANNEFIMYSNNTMYYSTNGETWIARKTNMPISVYRMAYGDGIYVALGRGGQAAYSTDCINWTETTTPIEDTSIDWDAIAYGDGLFVAISNDTNEALYSFDGITWKVTTLPLTGGWDDIVYGNGKFVVVRGTQTIAYLLL